MVKIFRIIVDIFLFACGLKKKREPFSPPDSAIFQYDPATGKYKTRKGGIGPKA